MAGHFILKNISTTELAIAQATPYNCAWSALQHANVGWTTASRLVLTNALAGVGIGNRDGLPPHRYLNLQDNIATDVAKFHAYLRGASWVERLVRPNSAGLGLRALAGPAATHWAAGRVADAVIAQLATGPVSIEIYYTNNAEMA
ncbi:hypothetical protein JRI60_30465 [Archangium violaceum]|uniref:hypothetical protein n=1 Tax=Archangium violaceum TaxID=83451 RepID=UPI00194FFAFA|nr:hypothetical protein [Archangium violaceum]QRN93497.1 hypothetical protein JRI60_30465 [Archangium violaceum]